MVTVGGPGYRWRGQYIRNIEHSGVGCATMPRKNSEILVPTDIKSNAVYRVSIRTKNNGGNGIIGIKFSGGKLEKFYVVSPDFKDYEIVMYSDGIADTNIKICRLSESTGNVLVESITYEEIDRPKTEEQIAKEKADLDKEKKLSRQKEFGNIQAKADKKFREKQLEYLLISRGEKMGTPVVIGGSSYRWKGKNIKSVFKHGSTCVEISQKKSMILIPITVPKKSNFSVTLSAAADQQRPGNGAVMLNFFGGQKYDGSHARINVSNKQMTDYTVKMTTPDFPPNTKMYLRVWRPSDASGGVCVKLVKYTQITNDKEVEPSNPIRKIASTNRRKRPSSTPRPKPRPKTIVRLRENYDMKFKPYTDSTRRMEERALKVFIREPNQVPKVSIITPTRDGLELIKECYTALNNNTAYPNFEWIVGDSDSKDGTVEFLKSLKDPRIKIVERKTIKGSFSSINNELTKHADGEYYLFLNDDTEPQPFWLFEMMSKIRTRPKVGAVGARLMNSPGRLQHAGIMFMADGPGNVSKPILKGLGGEAFVRQDRYYQAVTAACLLMRAKDFKQVGGFDPVYHFCYEDVDLCLKIKHNLGKDVLYAANAILFHKESVTQKKHVTHGNLQKIGIAEFKRRWMQKVEKDMVTFMKHPKKSMLPVDISFVTCVNNMEQYRSHVVGSLFLNKTNKNYEIIPILNFGNPYSAAQALNLGIEQARGDIIVLCHQDIVFYETWIDTLFKRISELGNSKWGVLGTAGITTKDKTVGVIYNMRGKLGWRQSAKGTTFPVQTVDEHCMVIRRNSNLRFDERTFNGFHFYGPDLCLTAISKGMQNYGILCPLVHNSGSGSLKSGRDEFMRLLNGLSRKWSGKFKTIRTTTSLIKKGRIKTFIKF
jgi:GT2 family glycosyltransferase